MQAARDDDGLVGTARDEAHPTHLEQLEFKPFRDFSFLKRAGIGGVAESVFFS